MASDLFEILILVARPAAGKSEIIHYLKNIPFEVRAGRFHIGKIDEIDDFPMIWAWFEEDDALSQMEKPRLHTKEDGSFRWDYLWDVLIRRISMDYAKHRRDQAASPEPVTTLIEFARGLQHGGFRRAFANLSLEILQRAAILYIDVSYQESQRKNRRRFNPERPDSILEHGLSDEKLAYLYSEVDWESLSAGQRHGYLEIQNLPVPFVVFENEDDVTTSGGEPLGLRLEARLEELWELYRDAAGRSKK